ncbi:MAG: polyribonucleotide nucleotidyltransferase [Lentisphaerae bacterium RIFOXYB12_FULL_65_16]|nr:MAG: polyribonucleotide nucleotidyltransferase [Lentisphaerae bacterium RIFOXYA12_64_32]OGV84966.1 MAG: polyribonucleotide nucleotidyltransferase [Lentisphaerae bacterium RIFOXYB12_FULL_65_16]
MSIENVTINLGPGRDIVIETGKLALLAGGSVTVRQGETVVLVAACSAKPRPGLDFFPLQVDYRERFCASGMFPGGYFKREGRPTEKEILTSRMTDRPLRPLFPKGYIEDVQIMAMLLSADGENEADVLAIFGASAALMVSDLPFLGPIGALRVGRIDGSFVANPTHSEMEKSDLDLVYAGVAGKTIMIEGCANEISDEVLRDAFLFADAVVTRQIEAQRQMAARVNKPKKPYVVHLPSEDVLRAVEEYCRGKLDAACSIVDKKQRQEALNSVSAQMEEALKPRFCPTPEAKAPDFGPAFEIVTQQTVRRLILDTGKRMDGRSVDQIRPISCEVGILPRTHGSALFTRGETQALVTTTLGAEGDAQEFDVITGGKGKKPFYLHYNFPNFSVGETGRISGPGRREIGHGALAERSVAGMVPKDFPYTVRCVSDILASNGSSSMASVCGASLSLMDAGVPIARAVSGISVGLVTGEKDRKVLMVDIIGAEDHYGDMDFKVSGTRTGITGFQLDLKIPGLDIDTMYKAMQMNRGARLQILDIMEASMPQARPEMSPHAPKIFSLKINPERIGALIGPGGKVIRGITDSTGAQIDVNDDGTVNIFAVNGPAMEAAKRQVMEVTAEPEIGQVYRGVVKSVKEFGAFIEIIPGHEGLLHISEMADYRVNKVEDICKLGDQVTVKIIDIDERGRVRLSRKAALAEVK